jgi:hypothetical protein
VTDYLSITLQLTSYQLVKQLAHAHSSLKTLRHDFFRLFCAAVSGDDGEATSVDDEEATVPICSVILVVKQFIAEASAC